VSTQKYKKKKAKIKKTESTSVKVVVFWDIAPYGLEGT
jgi:hypothetical protein